MLPAPPRVKMNATTPATSAMPSAPNTSHAARAGNGRREAGADEAPDTFRAGPSATTGTAKKASHEEVRIRRDRPDLAARPVRSGSASSSPSIDFMIASTPASMPPAKSPLRKRGATMSAMMRRDSASVSVPCTPRPVWMRILRSCWATTNSTPSSTPLRPSFHSSVTRPAKSSIASPSSVGTSSTATCEPLGLLERLQLRPRAPGAPER